MRFGWDVRRAGRLVVLAGMMPMFSGVLCAQVIKAPRYESPLEAPTPQLNLPPLPPAITPHGVVVEDIVVRVNDQIITRSDVMRQEEQLAQAAAQPNYPKDRLADEQKNLLRDMIDQQLLLSRAKELGLNADADVIRQLDDMRKKNNIGSMEELEQEARKQGVNFEDLKAQIRNQLLTQMVVRDEVGRRLQMTQADAQKYYNEHKADFMQPEQIRLSEILIPTPESATDAQLAQADAKAKDVRAQLEQGADFADLARKYSGGPSAAQGGDLGLFKRGALAKVLEDQTFALQAGQVTQPIRTRQGYVILKVTKHDQAGPAPIADVQPQIEEALYMQQMQPALRAYLSKLREDSYVDVQPGFVDSGATASETKPLFTAYAPPAPKKKKNTSKARFDRNAASARNSKPVISSPDTTGGRTLTGADAQTVATPAANSTATVAKVDPATGMAVITPTAAGKKPKLAKREKIRFGQAPRNTLPGGGADEPAETAATPATAAPGAAMASTPNTPETANLQDNPLTPQAPEKKKTRYAATFKEVQARKATTLTPKQQEKVIATPVALTTDEKASVQTQAAPLGLNGDTTKKKKKPKKVKGAPKERMQDQPVDAKKPAPPPVEQTANPALAPTAVAPAPTTPAATQPAPPPQL
jgi:peptidyl-prolyl cis-trans isomerase SurA